MHDTRMADSLLDDALFTLRTSEKLSARTLPEVFEALWREEVTSFELLRTHQQQAWGSLLAQLMTIALARGGFEGSDPAGLTAPQWRQALLALSGGEPSAWHLYVEEIERPAFMQTAIPEGSLKAARYRDPYRTCDELDILVTAKNHDLKRAMMCAPSVEQWIYALAMFQTMQGFLGRGNYGVVRMNGGYGNRPKVGLATGLSWSSRICRDVRMLLAQRNEEAIQEAYDARAGEALLWLSAWDGERGVALNECDPHFIEVCRRLRVRQRPGGDYEVWRASSKGKRIAAEKDLKGVTHDPWTPIQLGKQNKALTVAARGFGYELTRQLMMPQGEYAPSYASSSLSEERGNTPTLYFVAEALARGQGKTDGLHRRVVPLPAVARSRLIGRRRAGEQQDAARTLAERAKRRVELAGTVRSKVLYKALCRLSDQDIGRFTQAYYRAVDARFFEDLWSSLELERADSEAAWQRILRDLAQVQLERAIATLPLSFSKRWSSISAAEGMFFAAARKHLPRAFETVHPSPPTAQERP